MFVVDFVSAFILTFVLTVAFAAIARSRGGRRMRQVSAGEWIVLVVAWLAGIGLVAFGPTLTGTHWLAFLVSGLLVGLLLVLLPRMPKIQWRIHNETGAPGVDSRPLIAGYFIVTLLLFFCAISLRFYFEELA